MGREGFEPSTLGLRVEDGALADIRKAWRSRIVKPNVLARVGASSRRLVDFVLTPEREAWGDLNAAAQCGGNRADLFRGLTGAVDGLRIASAGCSVQIQIRKVGMLQPSCGIVNHDRLARVGG